MLEVRVFVDVTHEPDRLLVDLPMYPILAFPRVDPHFSFLIIDAEDACELVLKGNGGAVEDTVRAGDQVARDDGVAA